MTDNDEVNTLLRARIAAFVGTPGATTAANVLLELYAGPAQLYVYVDLAEPVAEGQPHTVLELPPKEGSDMRMVYSHLQLAPEDAALEQKGTSLACRPMPAWQVLRQCMQRGIVGLSINAGPELLVAIGPIASDKPITVFHPQGDYPDVDHYSAPPVWSGESDAAHGVIVPEKNAALRDGLAAFTACPVEETGADVLRELIGGQATLFVHVTGKAGAPGERAIVPEDLSLIETDDGRMVRMITVATKIEPEQIAPSLAAGGIYCRALPAWKLLPFCLQRGIMIIGLDPGLPTEVTVGPLGAKSRLRLVHARELQ